MIGSKVIPGYDTWGGRVIQIWENSLFLVIEVIFNTVIQKWYC